MRSRLFALVLASSATIVLGGCVQATRHSNTMVFGTNTTFGIKVGTSTGETPKIVVGYDRQEAVIMPLVANASASKGNPKWLNPCNLSQEIKVPAGSKGYAVHPCSLVAFRDGAQDSYSVLASFGAKFNAKVDTSAQASGGLAQYFATGIAAQILALTGGAAVVSIGDAATASAEKDNTQAVSKLLSGSAQFIEGQALGKSYSAYQARLIPIVAATKQGELDTKLGNFENRSGTLHKAGPQCSGKTPQVCSSFVEERDLYLDDFASDPAKFEQALVDWDKPKEVEND